MRFECQESCGGKCCKPQWDGKAGFVYLTKQDIEKLSAYLQQPIENYAEQGYFTFTRFMDKLSRQWYLKGGGEKACQFLVEGKCSIYEARPLQCRTFPFWPELTHKGEYIGLKKHCPGIGKGKHQTNALLEEQIKADEELCRNRIK